MDELTSALLDSATAEGNSGGQTIEEAPQQAEGNSVESQAQSTPPAQPQRRSLYDDPDFRAVMSARDAAHAAQMRQLQQQYEQLQQQYEQVALKDMDDVEKAEWQAQKAQQEAARYRQILEQQQQAAQLEAQKRADLERIASLTGVSVDKLQDAESYDQAWERAVKLMKGDAEQKKAANMPYLGGGTASTPATRRDAAIRDAFKANNSVAAVRSVLFDD